jgi:hypothetical protein
MRYPLINLIALFIAPLALAETPLPAEDLLVDFVVGRYHLVGRQADGEATYQGRVEIFRAQRSLRVRRTINGVTVEGSAAIEAAPLAETRVLRLRFTEADTPFECTCLVQGDLDNYARLTCYRYRRDGKTRQPGLEALFHDPGWP